MAGINVKVNHNYTALTDLINQRLEVDQGNSFRRELGIILPQLSDAYESNKIIQFRSHMGASLLGRKCKRQTWYSFVWAKESNFDGRMIRLFNRGHLEEGRFIALLRQAGIETWFSFSDGKQFAFSNCDGHYGGSLDCVVKGVIGYEDQAMLGEFKTHSEKSFKKLITQGVKNAKPEHFIQMNQYMGHYKLTKGLYMAVCKNDDEIYCEIVDFDEYLFGLDLKTADFVSKQRRAPMRHTKERSHFECVYCDYKDICWNNHKPQVTCRTCTKVKMLPNGVWFCSEKNLELDKQAQYNACSEYTLLPEIN